MKQTDLGICCTYFLLILVTETSDPLPKTNILLQITCEIPWSLQVLLILGKNWVHQARGKDIAIIGHGAFAVENVGVCPVWKYNENNKKNNIKKLSWHVVSVYIYIIYVHISIYGSYMYILWIYIREIWWIYVYMGLQTWCFWTK